MEHETPRQKLLSIMNYLSSRYVEREDVILALILGVILGPLGVNVLIAGPPGTAKTSIVKDLAGQLGLSYGELTIYPTMLPNGSLYTVDQIRLVKNNEVVVNPSSVISSEIVFFDELGRANEAFLHALISLLLNREIVVDQFGAKIVTPMITAICATNYIPDDERFSAVFDRIQLKVVAPPPRPGNVERVVRNSIERMTVRERKLEVIPVTRQGENQEMKRVLAEALSEAKNRAGKYTGIVSRIYEAFNLHLVGEGNGVVQFNRDMLPPFISVKEYRVRASLRSLSFIPVALGAFEYLHGSLTLSDIARVVSLFLLTPEEMYYPLFLPVNGKSFFQGYLEGLLKDVVLRDEVDTRYVEEKIRDLSALVMSVRKGAKKVDGCNGHICIDNIDVNVVLKEIVRVYRRARDTITVNTLQLKIDSIEDIVRGLKEVVEKNGMAVLYNNLLRDLGIRGNVKEELTQMLRESALS